ncbi:mitotic checkpoint serine/threonine-protein kinase BUB1 beta isoform X2 [Acanthochromis polyacanthus]|uniref:mitotic checkpoint serine/threonine-protein kinase BUB1 beta isoform X2 n=1 Tax=Acanthochromis polyacanthus TaxID=80966 RepID=UPI002234B04C|nr:mitotic checkpoint serine/threonine-protein kinase BUB1 beta isoform X2 [Acanthochromis polyacanthus]
MKRWMKAFSDLGAAVMEGLMLQVGSSAYMQSAYQSEAHPNAGVGLQEEGDANKRSAYCKDLLIREGGEELSFEELRAERYNQRKQREMEEKLKHLMEEEEKLTQELEEKKRLLALRRSQPELPHRASSQSSDSGEAPAAASFQIYDESQSAAAQPSGNLQPSTDELPDDVFLHPDERGLCLKIQHPRQPDRQGATGDDTSPPTFSQKPVSITRKKLSPIQETSVIASQEGVSTGTCSPLEEHPEEQEEMDHTASPAAAAVDPCHLDVRRRLLDLSDVTSSPNLHSETRPLPAVEEHNCVQLGGEVYFIDSRVVDGGSFSIFKGATDDNDVLLKVGSCSIPWDFHQFTRLKKNSSAADGLPLVSCFLFLDGCITVYTPPPDHMFTELTDCDPSELSVGYKAISLLQLVSQLHSCRLLHAALQPSLLTCCRTGITMSDRVLPVDWSSSVDLDLQQDVTSVHQLPSAQTYISLGLLEPTSPPQLVDLMGVAETVHLLLTNSKMVPVKDACGWTAEQFSGDESCDRYTRMWRRFFRSLLNAEGQSSLTVLSELKEQLSTLFH